MGRQGAITFESNGLFVFVHGKHNRFLVPGLLRDIRGYQAMYRDFAASIAGGRAPEMSVERAMDDHRLMDRIYASVG
jgi:predicted dehydrogenase